MDLEAQQRIEWLCGKTRAAIMFHLDRGEFDAMVRYYTEDVVFVRLGETLTGRGAILAAMAKRPGVVTRHLHSTTHFVEVNRDIAEAYVYNATYSGHADQASDVASFAHRQPHLFEFHDWYRPIGDDWLVARRVAEMVFKPADVT
jgi:ketosteroid isomerase-like protein